MASAYRNGDPSDIGALRIALIADTSSLEGALSRVVEMLQEIDRLAQSINAHLAQIEESKIDLNAVLNAQR